MERKKEEEEEALVFYIEGIDIYSVITIPFD